MYNYIEETVLTPTQQKAIDMLAYEDIHTIARKLNIDQATLEQWELQPAFKDAVDAFEDNLRNSLCREIVFEANRLFQLYCGLQEHMTLNQRIDFLAALSNAVSSVVKYPEKDQAQDALLELQHAAGLSLSGITEELSTSESVSSEDYPDSTPDVSGDTA